MHTNNTRVSLSLATMVPTIVIEEFREEGLEAVPEPTTNAIPMLRAGEAVVSRCEGELGEEKKRGGEGSKSQCPL